MLHLAIISIACAVSALSQGTAVIGEKSYESADLHPGSKGEKRKTTDLHTIHLPHDDLKVIFNSFYKKTTAALPTSTDKKASSIFFNQITERYLFDDKNSFPSSENFGKRENYQSNMETAFRKRNLLWIDKFGFENSNKLNKFKNSVTLKRNCKMGKNGWKTAKKKLKKRGFRLGKMQVDEDLAENKGTFLKKIIVQVDRRDSLDVNSVNISVTTADPNKSVLNNRAKRYSKKVLWLSRRRSFGHEQKDEIDGQSNSVNLSQINDFNIGNVNRLKGGRQSNSRKINRLINRGNRINRFRNFLYPPNELRFARLKRRKRRKTSNEVGVSKEKPFEVAEPKNITSILRDNEYNDDCPCEYENGDDDNEDDDSEDEDDAEDDENVEESDDYDSLYDDSNDNKNKEDENRNVSNENELNHSEKLSGKQSEYKQSFMYSAPSAMRPKNHFREKEKLKNSLSKETIKFSHPELSNLRNGTDKIADGVESDTDFDNFIENTIDIPSIDRDSSDEHSSFFSNGKYMTFTPRPQIKKNLKRGGLSLSRYLVLRHALRNHLAKNNIWSPFERSVLQERQKRCGCSKCSCSMPRKCWRSAPLLCIPYIRKGQDELLKYLIKCMQKMIGKPLPQKIDIFEKTKYKPCRKKSDNFFELVSAEPDSECSTTTTPTTTCSTPEPCEIIPACPTEPKTTTVCHTTTTESTTTTCQPPTTPMTCPTPPKCPSPKPCPSTCPDAKLAGVVSKESDRLTCVCDAYATADPNDKSSEPTTPAASTTPLKALSSCSEPVSTTPMPSATLTPPKTVAINSNFDRMLLRTERKTETPLFHSNAEYFEPICSWCSTKAPDNNVDEYFPMGMNSNNKFFERPPENYYFKEDITTSRAFPRVVDISSRFRKANQDQFLCSNFAQNMNFNTQNPRLLNKNEIWEYNANDKNWAKSKNKWSTFRRKLFDGSKYQTGDSYAKKLPYFGYSSDILGLGDYSSMKKTPENSAESSYNRKSSFRGLQKFYFPSYVDFPSMYDYEALEKYPFLRNRLSYSSRYPIRMGDFAMPWPYAANSAKSYKKRTLNKTLRAKRSLEDDLPSRIRNNYDEMNYFYGFNYNDDYPDPMNFQKANIEKRNWQKIKQRFRKSSTTTLPTNILFNDLARALTDKNLYTNDYSDSVFEGKTENQSKTENRTESATENTMALNKTNTMSSEKEETMTGTVPTPMSTTVPIVNASVAAMIPATSAYKIPCVGKLDLKPIRHPDSKSSNCFLGKQIEPISVNNKVILTSSPSVDELVTGSANLFETQRREAVKDKKKQGEKANGKACIIKGKESEKNLVDQEETSLPTTLKAASFAKVVKKMYTRPVPKVFAKVFPDSVSQAKSDVTAADTTTTVVSATTVATSATPKPSADKLSSQQTTPTTTPDMKLQLLAICEGYLEILKLIKNQNPNLGDEIDPYLMKYCENIISQSFNLPDSNQKLKLSSTSQASTHSVDRPQNGSESKMEAKLVLSNSRKPLKQFSLVKNRAKLDDLLTIPVYKRELENDEEETLKNSGQSRLAVSNRNKTKRNNMVSVKDKSRRKIRMRSQKKEEEDESSFTKGMTPEQVELLHSLRKRKAALIAWLNSKDTQAESENNVDNYYPFKSKNFFGKSRHPATSGTIAPKSSETSKTEKLANKSFFANDSVYPIYAKKYGYESGGELREVEVLWRKVNEKTHEKKILKNVSVLALLLTSTAASYARRNESPKLESNLISEKENVKRNQNGTKGVCKMANSLACTESSNKSKSTNKTYSVNNKPDPSSIVGTPARATGTTNTNLKSTTGLPNATRKLYCKVAKDKLQEFSIEFLNYAVYILPIMFTILFLFCCTCCFLLLWKNKKCMERKRRKKKKFADDDDDECTTDDSESASERSEKSKQKWRKGNKSVKDSAKRKRNIFLNVIKSARASFDENDESSRCDKNKNFLKFLKGRKMKNKDIQVCEETTCHKAKRKKSDASYHSDPEEGCKKVKIKSCDESETKDRKEIIALLDELKKIEIIQMEDKKEQKPIYVEYMTPIPDGQYKIKTPEPSLSCEKNEPSTPMHYAVCDRHYTLRESEAATFRHYDACQNSEELEELLPNCKCKHYYGRNSPTKQSDFPTMRPSRCNPFLKVFQGSSKNATLFSKDFFKSENKNFVFKNYRNVSTDTNEELQLREVHVNEGADFHFEKEILSQGCHPRMKTTVFEGAESVEHYLDKKHKSRLKDDGVLCRL